MAWRGPPYQSRQASTRWPGCSGTTASHWMRQVKAASSVLRAEVELGWKAPNVRLAAIGGHVAQFVLPAPRSWGGRNVDKHWNWNVAETWALAGILAGDFQGALDLVWAATAAKEAHAGRPVSFDARSAYSAGEAAEEEEEEEQGFVDERDEAARRASSLRRGKKGPRKDSKVRFQEPREGSTQRQTFYGGGYGGRAAGEAAGSPHPPGAAKGQEKAPGPGKAGPGAAPSPDCVSGRAADAAKAHEKQQAKVLAARLAQIEKQQADKAERARLHEAGQGPEPRRGQAPGAAEMSGVRQAQAPDGSLLLEIPGPTRARLGETDIRNIAARGKARARESLRTARRHFHLRYKREPTAEERDLFGLILDSDRALPDTWPPPADWRTMLPKYGTELQVRPEQGDQAQQEEAGAGEGLREAAPDSLPLTQTPKDEEDGDKPAEREGIDWSG
eukprot:645772-Amphidinium_carterae.3